MSAIDTASLTAAGANYGFGDVNCRVQNATLARLKAIYYPATKTGYWFGYGDSYSNYGMLRRVRERRAMNCTNPTDVTAQATFAADANSNDGSGLMSREMVYSHTTLPG